ncbi:MAG: aminotransferase class I/II-fold pyridoxal phosphate-dependent enzyme, partial [Betaproteobacteria bacterium]|nr:aminotransferase class I/II-fold pyridoxal phosphate-dependent enzyme [Betaproteobacteria bacterium]
MFEKLESLAPDAIIGIMALFREDQDPRKVDLSVGVFQDEQGHTPVMACVKQAEREIIDAQTTKTYVGIAGNADFNRGMEALLLGADHSALRDARVATIQSPGGSGGLCVA